MATAIVNIHGIDFHGLRQPHIIGPGVDWEGLRAELLPIVKKISVVPSAVLDEPTDDARWELNPGTFVPEEIMPVLERYGFQVTRASDNYDENLQSLD